MDTLITVLPTDAHVSPQHEHHELQVSPQVDPVVYRQDSVMQLHPGLPGPVPTLKFTSAQVKTMWKAKVIRPVISMCDGFHVNVK